MDKWIEQLIVNAPVGGAIILTIVLFMRFIRAERDAEREHRTKMSDQCHEVQREALAVSRHSSEVIEENTKVIGGCMEVMRDTRELLTEMKKEKR